MGCGWIWDTIWETPAITSASRRPRAQCNLGNVRADGRGAAKNEARAAALSKGIVAMRRIHRAFPQFSNTPYRFDAAPNAVNDWDAGFDVRAYATHGVMHGVYHYMLRGPVPPP